MDLLVLRTDDIAFTGGNHCAKIIGNALKFRQEVMDMSAQMSEEEIYREARKRVEEFFTSSQYYRSVERSIGQLIQRTPNQVDLRKKQSPI